jgi:hypothetical protein
MNIIKLVAGLAWAGAAISSATPVNALAITNQTGNYAACGANTVTDSEQISCLLGPGEDEPFFCLLPARHPVHRYRL